MPGEIATIDAGIFGKRSAHVIGRFPQVNRAELTSNPPSFMIINGRRNKYFRKKFLDLINKIVEKFDDLFVAYDDGGESTYTRIRAGFR